MRCDMHDGLRPLTVIPAKAFCRPRFALRGLRSTLAPHAVVILAKARIQWHFKKLRAAGTTPAGAADASSPHNRYTALAGAMDAGLRQHDCGEGVDQKRRTAADGPNIQSTTP